MDLDGCIFPLLGDVNRFPNTDKHACYKATQAFGVVEFRAIRPGESLPLPPSKSVYSGFPQSSRR